jgi:uncharacterized protein (TIGR02147 family)
MNKQYSNIFDYADFRKFLSDYQKKRSFEDKSFTKSKFCKLLGMKSTRGFVTDVINGKSVSKTITERFIQTLEFDEEEAIYFRVLVQFNQSMLDRERDLLFDQLISLNRTPKRFVDKKAYAYYSKWYHSAIFTVLDLFDFKANYKELAGKLYPSITPTQARASVALLKKLKLIKQDDRGCWRGTDKAITTGEYVQDELVKQYQLQCLELAKSALLMNTVRSQNISTMTLSTSKTIHNQIEKKLQKFKSEIRSMVHKDSEPADRVYQLNLQFFPQSK